MSRRRFGSLSAACLSPPVGRTLPRMVSARASSRIQRLLAELVRAGSTLRALHAEGYDLNEIRAAQVRVSLDHGSDRNSDPLLQGQQ